MNDAIAIQGDCRQIPLPDESVDAVVTDPPYGLAFMGKSWDHDVPGPDYWREVYRVMKPGAHLLAFGGTRTWHWLTVGIEEAGFEIRDCLSWMYGTGFPKSHDISKAIDKRREESGQKNAVADFLRSHIERVGYDTITEHFGFADETMARARWTSHSQTQVPSWDQWCELKDLCGFDDPKMDQLVRKLNQRKGKPGEAWKKRKKICECEKLESWDYEGNEVYVRDGEKKRVKLDVTAPHRDEAKQWDGWGTALKPSWEPIVLAMKPTDGTFAENALEHGVAGLNVDGCRVGVDTDTTRTGNGKRNGAALNAAHDGSLRPKGGMTTGSETGGRWPANTVLSHSRWCVEPEDEDGEWDCPPKDLCPVRMLDEQSGELSVPGTYRGKVRKPEQVAYGEDENKYGDDVLHEGYGDTGGASRFYYCSKASRGEREAGLPDVDGRANHHPTVKPIDLCRWLVRLVTRPGHLVLDPFAGSGSIGCAALQERRRYIGLDLNAEYVEIARARLRHWYPKQVDMFADAT